MKKLIFKKDGNNIVLKDVHKLNEIKSSDIKPKPVKKKKRRKKPKAKIDTLEMDYLDYDLDIDEEFKKTLQSKIQNSVDMSLINKLPVLASDKIVENIEPVEHIKISLKVKKPRTASFDIDVGSLDKQLIGNKTYYIDFDKGIIYDKDLICVGNIGEFGEINI